MKRTARELRLMLRLSFEKLAKKGSEKQSETKFEIRSRSHCFPSPIWSHTLNNRTMLRNIVRFNRSIMTNIDLFLGFHCEMYLEIYRRLHFQPKKEHKMENLMSERRFRTTNRWIRNRSTSSKTMRNWTISGGQRASLFSVDIVSARCAPGQGPNYEENVLVWPTLVLSEDVWDGHTIPLGISNTGHHISLAILTSACCLGQCADGGNIGRYWLGLGK